MTIDFRKIVIVLCFEGEFFIFAILLNASRLCYELTGLF